MSDPKRFDFNDHAEIARKDNIKPKKAVEIFAGKMEKRLQEKDNEYGIAGWLEDDCGFEYLVEKIIESVEDVDFLSRKNERIILDKTCVDIANFAMMISDKMRHESESGRS